MQRRHRGGQAQAEAGAGLGAAGFQPDKALHRVAAVSFRNSRPVVGDAEQHGSTVAPRLDQNLIGAAERTAAEWLNRAKRLAVLDGILHEVSERLAEQFTV